MLIFSFLSVPSLTGDVTLFAGFFPNPEAQLRHAEERSAQKSVPETRRKIEARLKSFSNKKVHLLELCENEYRSKPLLLRNSR